MKLLGKYILNRAFNLKNNNQNNSSSRKFLLLIAFLIVVLISNNSYAQDVFYPEIERVLTGEQKIQLDQAKKILKMASGNENKAESIDRKYAKLERKKNKTNWEEKTWEAKQQRVLAEKNFQRAYRMIFDLYSGLITNASYLATSDETMALTLNDKAYTKFEEADTKLTQIKGISKEGLAQAEYLGIKDNLTKIHDLHLKGIGNQISALKIFIKKGVNTQNEEDVNLAWELAIKDNTIASYRKYLNNYPQGKNQNEAKNRIKELVNSQEQYNDYNDIALKNGAILDGNQSAVEGTNRNIIVDPDLIFKVQIAASKENLSGWFVNSLVPNEQKVDLSFVGDWTKYTVGKFNSYDKAAKYRDLLLDTAPGAFIVVFKDDVQIKVTYAMKYIPENLYSALN